MTVVERIFVAEYDDVTTFATIKDLQSLWRTLKFDERDRAEALLDVVSNSLRHEAQKVGKDLDEMIAENLVFASVVKSVTVDVVARTLMTSTDQEPMTQFNESALGYSVSGSYLVPGGGLFIKDSELKRLGLKKQRFGARDIYGID
ncbi:TPA: phage Gp19/Gp15/Gp42 family protein [Streptococcus suis]